MINRLRERERRGGRDKEIKRCEERRKYLDNRDRQRKRKRDRQADRERSTKVIKRATETELKCSILCLQR